MMQDNPSLSGNIDLEQPMSETKSGFDASSFTKRFVIFLFFRIYYLSNTRRCAVKSYQQ